jgi:hypothetical protein
LWAINLALIISKKGLESCSGNTESTYKAAALIVEPLRFFPIKILDGTKEAHLGGILIGF